MIELQFMRKRHCPSLREVFFFVGTAVLSALCYMYFFVGAVILCLLFMPLWVVSLAFDPDRRIMHAVSSWLTYRTLCLSPLLQYSFEGLEHLRATGPCILVANHQSIIDILVLSGLPMPFKWVAKQSVFRIPALGWIMRMNGYICLSGSIRGRRRMFEQTKHWLKRGLPVLMFPEGTRSTNGELLDFKDGSFRLAIDGNVPVVPIVIDGTREILPKYARRLNLKARVRVNILPPVYPSECKHDPQVMRSLVRILMADSLRQMRESQTLPARLPAPGHWASGAATQSQVSAQT
jgi:1-acyl-sn-glycerol-3-phosphate acyltransferase